MFVLEGVLSDGHTKAFPTDEIFLTLSGRDSERLRFSTQVTSLGPGSSTFKLFCPVRDFGIRFRTSDLHRTKTSSRGTYILDQTKVTVSNLHLEWKHRTTTKDGKASRTKRVTPTLVRLVKDAHAFDVRLKRPHSGKWYVTGAGRSKLARAVVLGPGISSKLLLGISTGRNQVTKAKLKLTGPPDVSFFFQQATVDSDGGSQRANECRD